MVLLTHSDGSVCLSAEIVLVGVVVGGILYKSIENLGNTVPS